jgi:hypothetical protein
MGSKMTGEPAFSTEKELEQAIAVAATELLEAKGSSVVALQGFGLDVALFASLAGRSRTAFFEIKAFSQHHGRCGFGNQRGEGNQIRLLFDGRLQAPRNPDALKLFNPYIRWIMGNRSAPMGSQRFLFFTSEQAQAAAAGTGVRPGKQNNFRLSAFTF